MTDARNEIILHNYPQSPVAEKARVVLGIKGLNWRSVQIPRLPPKPELTKLSGGYRRTPVMQIGADIYCDTQCIIRELERRYPTPTLFPGTDTGLMWCLSRWTDGALFDLTVKIVLGSAGDALPTDFAQDRGRLYLGENWAEGLKAANTNLPHLVAQMRAHFTWLETQLSDGRLFLLGDAPAAIDAQIYYVVWFLRGRWDQGATFLSEFAGLIAWETRVKSIGHAQMTEMSPEAALARATECEPMHAVGISATDTNDPQGLAAGMTVVIGPDVDGGEQPVTGVLIQVDHETITVQRSEPGLGKLNVHFPRAGYHVQTVTD